MMDIVRVSDHAVERLRDRFGLLVKRDYVLLAARTGVLVKKLENESAKVLFECDGNFLVAIVRNGVIVTLLPRDSVLSRRPRAVKRKGAKMGKRTRKKLPWE